jgi:hypothetical protein
MPNSIKVQVDDPAVLLNAGMYGAGAIVRLESSASEAGAYASVVTAALVTTTNLYTLYDSAGSTSTWYRTRYENAGGSSFSDYSAAFQAGAEEGSFLCSLNDVEERLFGSAAVSVNEEETLLDIISEVSSAIEHATGRWLSPRPLSGTTTYRLHTGPGRVLRVPVGIRSITTLGIATQDQPESGGVYTTAAAASYYLDPPIMDRDTGWPATRIRFTTTGGGQFFNASFGAEITGTFGFAETPPDIRGVAIEGVTRKYLGKETASPAIAIGPDGGVRLLAALSPDARAIIEWYRNIPVG